MKGFNRQNQLFSLCGLNCPGCGGGEGNRSCKIAKCSMEYDSVQYCFQCSGYPCKKYDHIGDFDSFITHRDRKADMETLTLKEKSAFAAGLLQHCCRMQPKRRILI